MHNIFILYGFTLVYNDHQENVWRKLVHVYISVSELPVDIFEVSPETDKIMKNLGSLPLHIRQAKPIPSGSLSELYTDINNINLTVIRPEEGPPSQELSVKTLANMFDFRLRDPSMSKNLTKLIRESKLDSKYSPPIDVKSSSEC